MGPTGDGVIVDGDQNLLINTAIVADGDVSTIRIGTEGTATKAYIAGINGNEGFGALEYVVIDSATGQLGTAPAPAGRPIVGQLEKDIKTMDTAIAQQRDEFKALVAEQRKSIEILTARIKSQDDQLQRVTVRMEQNRVMPQKVANTK